MTDPTTQYTSPEEITRIGEDFYFNELKDKLEREANGQYVVIDVENKKYVVDSDKLQAIELARKDFGGKLFHIIQIGSVQKPTVNFRDTKYAWQL